MKRILLSAVIISASFVACDTTKEENQPASENVIVEQNNYSYFGDSITTEGCIDVNGLLAQLEGKDSIHTKVEGKIEEVCQKKGCWMNIPIGEDQMMRVSFKDYAFFMPKDAAGKTVVIEGFAYNDTISVAELKHFAEDAGKTKEEIARINDPKVSISFEAHGVIIKN